MRIGIDLGGTKIAALALGDNGAEMARVRDATPSDYGGVVKTCAALIHALEKETGQQGTVGIGLPGVVHEEKGEVCFSPNVKQMMGMPFARDLGAALGRPIKMANDAACFALSEAVEGAGKSAQTIYGIIIGTGVGGSLIVDKKIAAGANHAREWGHVPLPWADAADQPEPCGCGRMGCIESYLSGPALHRQLRTALDREIDNHNLLNAIKTKDEKVMAVMNVYITRLAKALAMLVTILDPQMVILGGGVSNIPILYDEVPKRWQHYSVVPSIKTQLAPARFGDDSGLRGAAWLWPESKEKGLS